MVFSGVVNLARKYEIEYDCELVKQLVSGQLPNNSRHLDELTHEPPILQCDTGQWLFCFDSCQLTISWMANVKDVDLLRHAWDTPPFLLTVSPTLPVQSVDAYVRTYVRTLGQSRDNQKKRGWPYSMSMGLCPTRASRAREPRYQIDHEFTIFTLSNIFIHLVYLAVRRRLRWCTRSYSYKVVFPIIQSYVFIVSLLNPTVTYLLCFMSFYCILSLCVAIVTWRNLLTLVERKRISSKWYARVHFLASPAIWHGQTEMDQRDHSLTVMEWIAGLNDL